MKASTPPSYGTREERAMLEEWAERPTAARLLSNYIEAAEKRTVWTGIDKDAVLLYAHLLLGNARAAELTAKRKAGAA